MPITPTYFLGLELKHLAATVNASACWRALVAQPTYTLENLFTLADAGTSNEANGLAAIHKGVIDADSVTYPLCIIGHMTDGMIDRISAGEFQRQGLYIVQWEVQIPTTYDSDIKEGQEYWREVLGRIIVEMQAAVRTSPAGKLDIHQIGIEYGLVEPDRDNNGRRVGLARVVFQSVGENE